MKIFASFSGGKSSARMCALLIEKYPKADIKFVFANTGKEHPKTLEFVNQCDKHFNLNLVWVEAKVHHKKRMGSTHSIVDFKSASRNAEPFHEVIKKYGIPNVSYLHCTRELKINPMYSYMDSIGWTWGTYRVAIGIRVDEPNRIEKDADINFTFYPLVEEKIDKSDVLDFWNKMPFNLEIKEHEGNCTTCFKKSDIKHVINIKNNPEWYSFNKEMEQKYSNLKVDESHTKRVFFRKNRSTEDMFNFADAFTEVPNEKLLNNPTQNAGCAESCEAIFKKL